MQKSYFFLLSILGWWFCGVTILSTNVFSSGIQVKSFNLYLGTARTFSVSKEAVRFENAKKSLLDISLDQDGEKVYVLALAKGHTVVTWFNETDEVIEKWMMEVSSEEDANDSELNIVSKQKRFLHKKVLRLEAKVFTWRDQDSNVVGVNPNFESAIAFKSRRLSDLANTVELPVVLQGMQDRLDLLGAPRILIMEGAESTISLGGEILVEVSSIDEESSQRRKSHWKRIGLEMSFTFLEFRNGFAHLNIDFQNSNPEGAGFLLANNMKTQLRLSVGEEKEVAEFKLENELKENWGHSFFKKIPILSAIVGQNRNSKSQVHMRVWVKVLEEKAN